MPEGCKELRLLSVYNAAVGGKTRESMLHARELQTPGIAVYNAEWWVSDGCGAWGREEQAGAMRVDQQWAQSWWQRGI
jgi:hypothetical protein